MIEQVEGGSTLGDIRPDRERDCPDGLPPEDILSAAHPGILDRLAEGVAVTGPEAAGACVLYCNPAFEAMYGFEHGACRGEIHPLLRGELAASGTREALLRRLRGEEDGPVSLSYIRQDGIPAWNVVEVTPLREPRQDGPAYLWVHRDVSQHIAVDERWQRFEFIVNTSPQFMALVGHDGRYEVVNEAFANALGGTGRDFARLHGRQVWGGEIYTTLIEEQLAVCFRGERARVQTWLHLPGTDGPRYLDLTHTPYRDANGQVTHAVFVAADLSDEKRASDALETLNLELEQRVFERTAALDAALQELDAFNYTIAHDLRAPLRFLASFARTLADDFGGHLPAEARRYVDLIAAGAGQMQDLIQKLLMLSRLGRQPLKKERVDVGEVVRALASSHALDIEPRDGTIQVQELPPIHADPTLLRQVFANLFANAVKFCAGNSRPNIVAACEEETDDYVVYSVRDNGIGFNMTHATTIFDAFKQVHEGNAAEGSGLGLAIVKRIVERHGGAVWAEGEEARGATFFVRLPKEAGEPPSPRETEDG